MGLDYWSKHMGGCVNSHFKQSCSPKCFIQRRIYGIFHWALNLLTNLFVSFGDSNSSPPSNYNFFGCSLLRALKKYFHPLVFCFTEGYKLAYCVSIRLWQILLKKPPQKISTCVSLTQEGTEISKSLPECSPPELLWIREDYKENKMNWWDTQRESMTIKNTIW